MNSKEKIEKKINEIDENFDRLVSSNSLDIKSIEDLALQGIEECAKIINNHIENLVMEKIDERDLVSKKNENGKKGGIN